jgi:putative holliday junction resolvase
VAVLRAAAPGHSDKRLVGLDVGDRRIGIALSDPTGFLASPVEVYHRRSLESDVRYICQMAADSEADAAVVGLPVNMNGSEGPQAKKTRDFAHAVEMHGLPVQLWDERLSTVEAERLFSMRGKRRRGPPKYLDAAAASIILQSYLDFRRMQDPR